jgi:hypothetical protein
MTLLLRLSATLLALALLPGLAAAQAVAARVVDGASGRPVEGALVTLLDDTDHQRTAGLTGADGRVLLQALAPGSYRVRAERVGVSSPVSTRFTLAVGETREEVLEVAPVPVQLEGLVARAGRRCVMRGGDDADVNMVWEEARKALNAAAWTESLHLVAFRSRRFERELERGSLRVLREFFHDSPASGGPAYESRPAEELADSGYVRPDGDGWMYYAPDARVLLSDTFLDTHCFQLRSGKGANAGLVGLAFLPVRDGTLPDIQGVLWLDAGSSELKYLEFRYLRLPPRHGRRDAGGRVDFQRLTSGAWIVKHWWIRVEMAVVRESLWRGQSLRLEDGGPVREVGGEVTAIVDSGAPAPRTAHGVVTGRVTAPRHESLPAGLEVYLSGTTYRASVDSTGAFRIPNVPDGPYSVTLTTPRLAALGFPAPHAAVEVRSGTVALVRPPYPGQDEFTAAICPEDIAREEQVGAVYGTLRAGRTGAPLGQTRLKIIWTEGRRPDGRAGAAETVTNREGGFHLCGLPVDRSLEARAFISDDWRSAGVIRLMFIGFTEQDLQTAP